MKDELGGKIMEEFVGLRPKCYMYLMDDGKVDKTAKGTEKCVIKRCLMFDNYSECLKEKKKIFKIFNLNKDLRVMDMMSIPKRLIR